MDQQEWEHKIQGELLEAKAFKERLQEELVEAQRTVARLQQVQIDIAQKIKEVDGAISAYEKLLGIKKKPQPAPVKPQPKGAPGK